MSAAARGAAARPAEDAPQGAPPRGRRRAPRPAGLVPVHRPTVRTAPSLGAVLGGVVALVFLALLVVAGHLVVLALLGTVLAYVLLPVVNAVERRGFSRSAAAALVFLGLVLALAGLAAALAPVAIHEAQQLRESWSDGRIFALLDQAERDLAARVPFLEHGSLDLAGTVRRGLARSEGEILSFVPDLLSAATDALIVPFVLFFMLRDGPAIRRRLVAAVPNRYFEFAMGVLYKVDANLGGYLRSQSLVALFVGTMTTIGLGVVGVSNYAVLGFLTGVLNFVPYVGFAISFLLTLAVSVMTTGGFGQFVAIAVVFAIAQGIENFALQPWITGRNVSLHPVTVLLAIFIGDRAFGVMGMALAVPAAAVLKVVVVETAVTLRRFRL